MQNINDKNNPETSSNVVSDSSLAYKRMKSIATGLFIIMTAIYVISKFVEIKFHWVSYIRAFSEAAMVGALADWFAVTALFRHPMGIPIPHTAIIPNSKDRIGEGLGSFISRNFLQPEQVKKRLEQSEGKLNNQGFVAKAPEAVIEKVKGQAAKEREQIALIEAAIAALK